MFHAPREYKKLVQFCQYMVIFIALVILFVINIEKILTFFAWIVSILFPFFIGLGFAFVFNIISNNLIRVYKAITKKKETKRIRTFANLLSIIIFVLIFIAFFIAIIPQLVLSIEKLVNNIPLIATHLKTLALRLTKHSKSLYQFVAHIDLSKIDTQTMVGYLDQTSKLIFGSNTFVGQANSIISTTISWVTTFFISFVFSIFVIFNKKRFLTDMHHFFYAVLPENAYATTNHIYQVFKHTFARYIGGTLLECVILASLVIIGSTLLHLPYSFLCGFVIGIAALVPMFGALVAAFLCSLLIFAQSPTQGITFFVMFICIQQVEGNFIYPNVVGKSVGLPSMYVLVAITVGASIGGVLGMIVFIPVFSSFYRLMQEYEFTQFKKRGIRIEENETE